MSAIIIFNKYEGTVASMFYAVWTRFGTETRSESLETGEAPVNQNHVINTPIDSNPAKTTLKAATMTCKTQW